MKNKKKSKAKKETFRWTEGELTPFESYLVRVLPIVYGIECKIFGTEIKINPHADKVFRNEEGYGRVYLQAEYKSPCTKTGEIETWKGRKWYLSEHMTNDEVVKTAYAAFKAAVEHEVMEGFKYAGKLVFNPHTPFETLILASQNEVKRISEPKK